MRVIIDIGNSQMDLGMVLMLMRGSRVARVLMMIMRAMGMQRQCPDKQQRRDGEQHHQDTAGAVC